MKLGPVTKFDKRKKRQKIDDVVTSANCDVIAIFPIGGQLGAAQKLNFGRKLKFSLIVTFYLTKSENRTKKSQTQLSHYCFE